MSETVKLIIEIPKTPKNDHERWVLAHGTPLDSNSEKAEVQAYFAGQAYGWEQGRKALIEEVKAEIEKMPCAMLATHFYIDQDSVLQILDNIGTGDSE